MLSLAIMNSAFSQEKTTIGDTTIGDNFTLLYSSGEKGTEIAKLIKPMNQKFSLNTVALHIAKPNEDYKDAMFKVTLYEQDEITKKPGKKIITKDILISVDSKNLKITRTTKSGTVLGWLIADLSELNLVIEKPFYISFQNTINENKNNNVKFNSGGNPDDSYYFDQEKKEWYETNKSLEEDEEPYGWVIKCEGYYL
jgi:hypothetical protein